jgi:gliding motility-associated lipoprotein GldD
MSNLKQLLLYTFFTATIIGLLSSCGSDYAPKPRGYYRIELPAKEYKHYSGACHYEFDIPTYAEVVPDSSRDTRPCWTNVVYKGLNGRIHISYYDIKSPEMFGNLIEDSRRLAFKHTVKAEGIDESRISNPKEKVYGLYYAIDGNTASSVQFFLTDSNKHFLRGALYFYTEPRQDSIQPVLNFVKEDIDVMLKTFKWK